ncbi:uncharacterized protein LOC120779460 [Bactrocera tryoni]|uniref:uncharacterized protein LOC120779460 n=1 Tax=Bactrocera tryoni TaxID=59916 RepID=UPI001A9657B5|nr:uncharacterized protein LOC120779460 [Bactrocera tryoni]
MKMSEKKVRSGKVTKQQKQKFLDLLKKHRNVGTGQFGGPNSDKAANAVWATLTAELNACGGACKTVEQWKKNATGNRPASEGPAPLDGMDLQVLDFFPTALVDGDGVTKESGFQEMNHGIKKPQMLHCHQPNPIQCHRPHQTECDRLPLSSVHLNK